MNTWRLSASCFGIKSQDILNYEDYQHLQSFVRVFLVPESWVQKKYLPDRFFEEIDNAGFPKIIGCVKVAVWAESRHYSPCVIYNMKQESKFWEAYTEEIDPILYLVRKFAYKRENIAIFQSLNNPWHIGIMRSCDPKNIKPVLWKNSDDEKIFGINEGKDNNFENEDRVVIK